jgi:hypothetical protein
LPDIKRLNRREKLRQLTSYHTLKFLENDFLEDGVKFIYNVHPQHHSSKFGHLKQLKHYEPPLRIHPQLPHQTNETKSEQNKIMKLQA